MKAKSKENPVTVADHLRAYKREENQAREDQLAHKISVVAADPVDVSEEVPELVINRVIENASVTVASLKRAPIVAARAQALTHGPTTGGKGSTAFGIEKRVAPESAATANGVAVRELDYHNTFQAVGELDHLNIQAADTLINLSAAPKGLV